MADLELPTRTVKETVTREAVYPTNEASPFTGEKPTQSKTRLEPNDMAGVKRKDSDIVKMLNDLSETPEGHKYKFAVKRKSPHVHMGHRFPINSFLDSYDIAPFNELREAVFERFGGGHYEGILMIPEGDIHRGEYQNYGKIRFYQDIRTTPPVPDEQTTMGITSVPSINAMRPGMQMTNMPTPGQGDSERLTDLNNKRREARIKREIREEEAQLEDAEERREDFRSQRRIAESREDRDTFLAMKSQMDRDRDRADEKMLAMVSAMQNQTKEMIAMMNNKGDDSSTTNMMAMMMKSMNDNSMLMMKMFSEMQNGSKGNDDKMAAMQAESNKMFMTMMQAMNNQNVEQLKAAYGKSEALMEKLVSMRTESPEQRFEQMLKAEERGASKAKEWFELIGQLQGQAESDDVDWDPEASVMGNLGSLAFHGLKRLIGSGAGGRALGMLNSMFAKPAGNTQFDDAEIAAAAQQLQPYLEPPASVSQALPAPVQQPPQGFMPGQVLPDPTPPPSGPSLPAPQQQAQPQMGQIYEEIPQQAQVIPQAQMPQRHPVLPPEPDVEYEGASETSEDRLKYHINTMIEEVLTDIQDGRNTHQWPFSAFEVLNKSFLDEFSVQPDDSSRIKLIQKYADPKSFERLMTVFWQKGNADHYHNFRRGMIQLASMHKEKTINVASA